MFDSTCVFKGWQSWRFLAAYLYLMLAVSAGCGTNASTPSSGASAPKDRRVGTAHQSKSGRQVAQQKEKQPQPSPTILASDDAPDADASSPSFLNPAERPPLAEPGHPLGPLNPHPRSPAPLPPIDEDRIAAHGIRKLSRSHLTLYTDLPVAAAIEDLPQLFEQAVPGWCDYFEIDQPQVAQWLVRGCLMKDKDRFIAAGLLPPDLPPFANGYTRDSEIWLYEQSTDYYRNFLMLHEGTHSFMFAVFGTCGPPWYKEGLAELLGTYRLVDGTPTLGCFPKRHEDVPYWSRIEFVRDGVQAGRPRTIDEIVAYPNDAYLHNDAYGWSWALAAFLDGHPRYRERFRSLPGKPIAGNADDHFHALFADDWRELNVEWQVFIHEIDYGYDLVRNAVEFRGSEPLDGSTKRLTIAADRGWQSSGIRLEPGTDYTITAAGRYQLADQPRIWWCEPDGVTIRYHDGRPLGQLLAMVVPDNADEVGEWPEALPIGSSARISVADTGTLYFKVNDLPSELADNAGSLEVTIALAQR